MKVLFIQHAAIIGGSALSLKMLLQDGIEAGWKPYLVVQNESIRNYYRDVLPDEQMFLTPRMPTFDHHSAHVFGTTPREIARVLYRVLLLLHLAPKLRRIAKQVQPDTIHLNSSVLIPFLPFLSGSAKRMGVHIRERVAGGWRNHLFRYLLEKYADYCVFISPVEQKLLPARTRETAVVYNYIKPLVSTSSEKYIPSVENRKLTLLSLGGTSRIKGIEELLTLAETFPNDIQIRIVGALNEPLQNVVPPNVDICPPTPNPLGEISKCDFLIFWTHQPHFPRPIYEAWSLKKPCIASHCMRSQDDVNEFSVILANGDDASDLISTVKNILEEKPDLESIRDHAFKIAQEKFGPANFIKIKHIIEINQNREQSHHANA